MEQISVLYTQISGKHSTLQIFTKHTVRYTRTSNEDNDKNQVQFDFKTLLSHNVGQIFKDKDN